MPLLATHARNGYKSAIVAGGCTIRHSDCAWLTGIQAVFSTSGRESSDKHVFGVAGMHYRFDAFVKHFRQSTTLRDLLKFGGIFATEGCLCFIVLQRDAIAQLALHAWLCMSYLTMWTMGYRMR